MESFYPTSRTIAWGCGADPEHLLQIWISDNYCTCDRGADCRNLLLEKEKDAIRGRKDESI